MSWEDQGVEIDSADSSDELSYEINSNDISALDETPRDFSNSSESFTDTYDLINANSTVSSVCNYYFYGQISNVMKASVSWSMFGVIMTFFSQSKFGISIVRSIFNLSIILSSPFANILTGRTNIRKILSMTTLIRTAIWSLIIPLEWYYLDLTNGYNKCFVFNFLLLMFIDGLQVSFSNIVDIDCGGFDSLSLQYDVPISYTTRHKLNAIYQIIFDISFLLVSLPLAFIVYRVSISYPKFGSTFFVMELPFVFLLFGIVSICFYLIGIPRSPCQEYRNELTVVRACSLKVAFIQRLKDIFDGFRIIVQNYMIFVRLFFLAIETAFDDYLISLAIPYISMYNKWFPANTVIQSNLTAVFIISFCKLGGLIGTHFVQRRGIHIYSISVSYLKLSQYTLFSIVAILLLPASDKLIEWLKWEGWICPCLFGLVFFLFFLFNSLPKIWLFTLLQNTISNYPMRHNMYYFVSVFITLMDSILIICMNYYVNATTVEKYFSRMLIQSAGFYTLYGIIQVFIGPFMIF